VRVAPQAGFHRDRLREILAAAQSHRFVPVSACVRNQLTLISLRAAAPDTYDRVRALQEAIRVRFGLALEAVGGGPGCFTIRFRVSRSDGQGEELEELPVEQDLTPELVKAFIAGDEASALARQAGFDVTLVPEAGLARSTHRPLPPTQIVLVNRFVNKLEVHVSGDSYKSYGAAGIVGPRGKIDNFNQVWNDFSAGQSAEAMASLAEQLGKLKEHIKTTSSDDEDARDIEVGNLSRATQAAKKGDGGKVLEALSACGRWVLEVAEKIGVAVAASALRKALGLE
jgi:hypothetical protein